MVILYEEANSSLHSTMLYCSHMWIFICRKYYFIIFTYFNISFCIIFTIYITHQLYAVLVGICSGNKSWGNSLYTSNFLCWPSQDWLTEEEQSNRGKERQQKGTGSIIMQPFWTTEVLCCCRWHALDKWAQGRYASKLTSSASYIVVSKL